MNTTVKQIKAWKRRIRWAVFRYKWLKRNCPHICQWCRHRKICTVKYDVK